MRGRLLLVLGSTLGLIALARADVPTQVKQDEQTLKNAKLAHDGEALLEFFRHRTLPEKKRADVKAWIQQLGDPTFRIREQATARLMAESPAVCELLRDAMKFPDLEISRRAEKILHRILEKDHAVEVPAAAARLLAVRKPAGALPALLAYLPHADNQNVTEEVVQTLTAIGVKDGKADPVLVDSLADKEPVRRAAAAEALLRAGLAEHRPVIRKLLGEEQPASVRLRVATALVHARDRDAVAVLIDLLPHLSQTQAWQAEDVLFRLAEGQPSPPTVSLGPDEASRKKCRDAWAGWWSKHQKTVDLAKLHETPKLLGYTLVVLLDLGRIMELDQENRTRWQMDGLVFPLDAQVIPGRDHILVAEYHASRVTERDLKGEIVWQHRVPGPLVAQRLANGNTFIASDSLLLEVDRGGKEVMTHTPPNGERIMKAMKLPNGEIVCLTSEARVLRLDGLGKELHSFSVGLNNRLFGGRVHMLPNGRVIVPHNAENKVVEYDIHGKAVWEVNVDQPVAATRLPNGNTLVTTMLPNQGAIEYDRNGQVVWRYTSDTRVTRAVRR